MTIFNSLSHASTRRPSVLRDVDYDHEIGLIDHTTGPFVARTRSQSDSDIDQQGSISPTRTYTRRLSDVQPGDVQPSDAQLQKKISLREEIARRRYTKYQDRGREGQNSGISSSDNGNHPASGDVVPEEDDSGDPMRPSSPGTRQPRSRKGAQKERESAIDILYENQRGGFLCGQPLFSSKALGAADAPPWTNIALKPSATDITNAQVPDPSWEWVWKEWVVNHQDDVDENGWEYSFMYSKKCSWHGPSWYNSFVRRRAWIRKRVKKHGGLDTEESHKLNADYFTIHPSRARSRTQSPSRSDADSRYSAGALALKKEMEEVLEREDIRDIGHLMKALKWSRIDREKSEAVENFIAHGSHDLYYLKERMGDIMALFIFQASRRLLLAHLSRKVDEASEHRKKHEEDNTEENETETVRIDNLKAALHAADEEVKRLEFWSDIKAMAEQGEIKGAVDEKQGWGKGWEGLDESGPKDVLSERKLPGGEDAKSPSQKDEEKTAEANTEGAGTQDKGKGKEEA